MIVSINQPAYLPWLGYFDRIQRSDVHVVLDHVQFEKNSFTNRNKIKTKDGVLMLTVPVKTKGLFGALPINTIEVVNDGWQSKHLKSIQNAYGKAACFKDYAAVLSALYTTPYKCLIDVLTAFNGWFFQELVPDRKIIYSSEMNIRGSKSQLVLNICKELNATTYLSGPFGRDYLDLESFRLSGIQVAFHDYVHPVFQQAYVGFEPYMSIIDLILNHGKEGKKILNNNETETIHR